MKNKKNIGKNQTKKIYSIPLSAGIVFLVYILFSFYLSTYHFLPEPQIIEDCKSFGSLNRDFCISKLIYNTHSPDICNNLSEKREKDLCWGSLASDQNNPEYCHKINELKERDMCFCAMTWNTKNKQLCKFIQNKETCYVPPSVDPEAGFLCPS